MGGGLMGGKLIDKVLMGGGLMGGKLIDRELMD